MIKTLFATGALLAAATTVAKVGFSSEGVAIGGRTVTETTLQLQDTGDSHILASRDVVEPLGGVVEVALGEGRTLTVEPGVRVSRTKNGYELTTHGRRPMVITAGTSSKTMSGPVALVLADGAWTVGGNAIEGNALRAALLQSVDATRVAADDANAPTTDGTVTPDPKKLDNRKLDIRRVINDDPNGGNEAAGEHAVKRTKLTRDVSPSGF